MPENELFEVLQVVRRKLVKWLRKGAKTAQLDAVMDRVLRVSASTGSMAAAAGEGEELGRWAYVGGPRSHGRFARHSIRNGTSSQEATGTDETSSLRRFRRWPMMGS